MVTRLLVLPLLLSLPALAVPLDPVPLSGQRDTSAGISATSGWQNDFSVSWFIEQVGSMFQYTYTFQSDFQSISHLLLELSGNCWSGAEASSTPCVSDVFLNGQSLTDMEFKNHLALQGNPGLPSPIWGVKFDEGAEFEDGPIVYSFTSERVPMWGNFFAKGGQGIAFNNGLQNPASINPIDFIAVPNSHPATAVPEPGTVALLGAGLLALAWRRRR